MITLKEARIINSPYKGEVQELADKIFPFTEYTPNKVYKNENGFYTFINTQNYIHVIKPEKVKVIDKIYWTPSHYKLTPKGMLQHISYGRHYNTKDECILGIESE